MLTKTDEKPHFYERWRTIMFEIFVTVYLVAMAIFNVVGAINCYKDKEELYAFTYAMLAIVWLVLIIILKKLLF